MSTHERRVRRICWLALVGLAFTLWSASRPTPLSAIVAATVGQIIGVVALLAYVVAVLVEWRGGRPPPEQ